ncbi:hypothetical protein [Chelativorans salis]|uniref:Uncharacterized protein n=1 Tax=Chelativorans salis TaxID=2978478 RepID=A0ABT2LNW7_9HYPH|nr:hypothetical protein [Chelativorans sp. EGI FJ00035]MCT7376255.1 hypothetical protein [Chelativorans sp. EGI FJ00035]
MESLALTQCAMEASGRRAVEALAQGRLSREGVVDLLTALALIGLFVSALEIASALAGP